MSRISFEGRNNFCHLCLTISKEKKLRRMLKRGIDKANKMREHF